MKARWAIKPLGEICDILDSLRKPITKRDRNAGPYPYYGATGVRDYVAGYIFDEPLILIGEDGAKWGAGERSAFPVCGKVWVNNHAHVIRPIRSIVDDDWLVYFLNFSDLSEFITGLTVPKLNQGSLREIPIPLPLLDEQKRIIAILNEAFEGLDLSRANADANLADTQELFAATLARRMDGESKGWHSQLVEKTITKTKVPAKIQRKDYQEQGRFPIVSQEAELINGYWDDDADVVQAFNPIILFGDHTRHLKYIDFDFVVGADGTQILRPISDIDPRFYYYALRNIPLESKGYARHFSALKKCRISYPASHSAQQRIANELTEIENYSCAIAKLYISQLEAFTRLRQSLLQKAFSGELT